MKIENSILTWLENAHKEKSLICAIQFGSSVYNKDTCNDIDLALVVKDEKWEDFTSSVAGVFDTKYDISLIRESELSENFFFGNHGVYLVEAFSSGISLVGENVFINLQKNISEIDIKKAIFERMKEYVYILRKSYFLPQKDTLFLSRYVKFLRLGLILLFDISYSDGMKLKPEEIYEIYEAKGYGGLQNIELFNKKILLETIWIQIRKRYS